MSRNPESAAPGRVLLGLGECLVELAPAAQDGLYQKGFAGDVFNTLWYSVRCLAAGWQVRFLSAVGTDPVSDDLISFAHQAGIDCRAVLRLSGAAPGLYMISLEGGERRFQYWRGQSAARRMMYDQTHVAAQIAEADVIYASGITLAILPPDHRLTLITEMRKARAEGKLVVFDSNIRPALWEDADTLRNTLTAAGAAATVVLPSFEDEAALFGDATPQDTAHRYAAAGGVVIVKNGPLPVITLSDGVCESIETPALDGPVIDSTAAGDAFNAAFLAEYLRSYDIPRAVRAGQGLAACVVSGRGALVDTLAHHKGADHD